MIVKFSQPSDRVKGISFHPTRPWLLTALYSGVITLWDYRLQQVVDKYEGHIGPVRAVQFHPKLSLFVSGGDDTTVRVWNYTTKKEQFLLKGHLDYVRCVGFHTDQPWVISSADDQTARIWNYQSRQMIAIMTGHSNYVMQCQFHPDPTKEFIVTCSLDLTARLWSYTPLKQKYAANKKSELPISGAEIVLIAVLSGHKDQLNWCTFHPTQPFIATAADDKKIILWKYNESKCWQFDTLSGHNGNVNSVVFHPKIDVIISNSEDKTTRVWDFNTKQEIQTYSNKEQDRFWIVSAHQDNYYFACGSDSSFIIFTLFRDRVPMVLVNNNYLCIGDKKQIKVIELQSKNTTTIKDLQPHTSNISSNLLKDNIIALSYNQYNTSSTQLLLKLQPETKGTLSKFVILSWEPKTPQNQDIKFFTAFSAIFVGKTKILKTKEDKTIEIYNMETDSVNQLPDKAETILQAPGGKCLIAFENDLSIYDPLAKKIIATVTNELIQLKQAVWSGNFVAILGKKSILIYTKTLTKVLSISEQIPIKSAVWVGQEDSPAFLVYTTKSQVKYVLLNGETGVIKSTEHIYYLAKANINDNQSHFCNISGMDNSGNLINENIDLSEAIFKQALYEKNAVQIQQLLSQQKQFGDSMISYLYKKKYSSLAMDLVQDVKARFQLAISSHNLEVAFRACTELKDRDSYQQLCSEALRQGNQQIVELCHQSLSQIGKLSFLYAILGERDKQLKLQQKSIKSSNSDLRFQTGTYIGDPADRVKQLWESGNKTLAYYCAVTHGLSEEAQEIQGLNSKLSPKIQLNIKQSLEYLKKQKTQALVPPPSIIKLTSETNLGNINWPHNFITTDQLIQLQGTNESSKLEEEIAKFNKSNDTLLGFNAQPLNAREATRDLKQEAADELEAEGQWGLEEEILVEEQPVQVHQTSQNQSTQQGNQGSRYEVFQGWNRGRHSLKEQLLFFQIKQGFSSPVPSTQLLVGNVAGAIQTLQKQIALIDPSPLKDIASSIIISQQYSIAQIPFLSNSCLYLTSQTTKQPIQAVNTIKEIRNLVKQGYKQTTEGKFSDTLNTFNEVIQKIPLLDTINKEEQEELNQLISVALSYILAMKCELNKKKVADNQARVLELGCYMTLCNLQPTHHTLTLRSCMSLAVKVKNYITGAQIARKLLQVLQNAPEGATWAKPELTQSAIKILKSCEQQGTNALKLKFEEPWLYDDKIQGRISSSTLTIIEGQVAYSPYVNASYEISEDGKLCQISNICMIGKKTLGLKLYE